MVEIVAFAMLFVLFSMAISNLSDILTTVDLLVKPRDWFALTFPRLGKIATCKYCQSWWMSGAASVGLVSWAWPSVLPVPFWVSVLICWVALHLAAKTLHKLDDGIPIVFPMGLFVISNEQEEDED
jgi:hypothetical protein